MASSRGDKRAGNANDPFGGKGLSGQQSMKPLGPKISQNMNKTRGIAVAPKNAQKNTVHNRARLGKMDRY